MMSSPDFDRSEFRAVAAAKRSFFAMFHRCERREVKPEYQAFMATGEPVVVGHADEHLEVRSWGAGPTVLLAHGMFGSGGMFRAVIPALVERGHRAIAFDAPGHGASAGTFAHADEIADSLLSVEGVVGPLAGVVGHSMGALWAMHAMRAGLRTPRFVCLSMPVETSMVVDVHARRQALDPRVTTHLQRLLDAFLPSSTHPLSLVARLETQALVIHDHDDPLVPFELAEKLVQRWPGSTAMWTSKLGHFNGLKAPLVASAIADFISGAPLRDAEPRRAP